jgi:broad specificity phosphatase PhoE
MTRFYLIRHGAIDGLGQRIAGRLPGIALNASGRDQAARLARRLARESVYAIYTSPQRRTVETSEAMARVLGLKIQIAEELDEIDFGDWTGKTYEELGALAEWRDFNLLHSSTRIPNGELLLEAQSRVVGFLGMLSERHPDKTIALVSHGDVIRVALAHQLGIPIDFIMRFDIGPASISAVELHTHGPRVLWINSCPEVL